MNPKVVFSLFVTTLLVSEYPFMQAVQANQPIQVAQSVWKEFSSSNGNFSILMPGTPAEERQTIDTEVGPINVQLFQVLREGEAGYVVGYADLPKNIIQTPQDVEEFFGGTIRGIVNSLQGRLLSQRNVKLGNYPGREIKIQAAQGVMVSSRIYLVNQRFYQILVLTAQEQNLSKSIQGFLNSFRLLKTPSAPANVPQEDLNALLQTAVCSQNWSQAVRVVDRMIAANSNADVRTQLTAYRQQLQGFANSKVPVPADALSGCSAGR